MTSTYISPRSSTVMVDRAWAQSLGLNQISGARRVGNFYRLPRVAYLRTLRTMQDQASEVFEVPTLVAAAEPVPVAAVASDLVPAAVEQAPAAVVAVEPVPAAVDRTPVAPRRSLSPCVAAAGIESNRARRTTRALVSA